MYRHFFKSIIAVGLLSASINGVAQIDTHEVGDMGYLCSPMETANGIITTNNRYSEIYSLNGNTLTPILKANNCGLYTNLSKDGRYLGFKSFNDNDEQAPAILDVTTGRVTILEDYIHQCGQVSFADDGTMAYTMGNSLIIRKGNSRKAFDLGFYTNIANISPDGSQVAYSNIDGRMFVINLTTGAKETIAIDGGYRAIWSPDGTKIAVHVANGTLAVQDRMSKHVYNIGEGEAASWANNSEELIFTRIDRKNDFEVTGSSIKKVNFDGSNEISLVTSSDNMPTDAILTSDNKLLIPYKTGTKRGLMMKTLTEGLTPVAASVKEESVIKIDAEEVFGTRLDNPCDNPNVKPQITTSAFQQKIGANDIPYLSQIYDSPSMGGCTRWGYVSCAPTSACMYLGYYGLLDKKATTSRYDGSTKYYAYAIGQKFTNQAGTATFNLGKYKYCGTIYGAYGYMWNTGSPQSHMVDFLKLNGCTSASRTYSTSTAWSTFQKESAAGRPYILCGMWGSSGHVVLGFATNCKYRGSSGFTEQIGSFVCHDPYGDYNDSSWADGDGQHSTYDWVGYNNGQGNIGSYAWSVNATPPNGPAETVSSPYISVSSNNVNFSCVAGETAVAEVTVDGNLLNQWATVSISESCKGIFSVTPTGLNVDGGTHNFSPANPKLTITFTPDKAGSWGGDINNDGYDDYIITLHSVDVDGKDVYQWITLNGTATEPYISVSSNNLNFNCNAGETATAEVTVDGYLLNQWTTVSISDNCKGIFSVTPTGLNVDGTTHDFSPENPKLTITFTPDQAGSWGGDIDNDGYNDYIITLHSVGTNGQDVYQWITLNGTATSATQPYISVNPNNLDFTCMAGESATAEVIVDGNMLNQWTTVSLSESCQGIFSVTPTGLEVDGATHNFSPGHTKLTIKFSPKEVGTWGGDINYDGYNDYYITLHSIDVNGNDVYQWITLNGTATAQPYISVSSNNLNFSCNVGETASAEVTVDGNMLNQWTTVTMAECCKGIFSVTPDGLEVDGATHNFSPNHTKLTVKFAPTTAGTWSGDNDGDGYRDYVITLHSIDVNGNDVFQWIFLNGEAKDPSSKVEGIGNNASSIRIIGKTLYVSGTAPASIEIYSTAGSIVSKCYDSPTLNISALPLGIYIAKITTANGQTLIKKISIK